MTHKNTLYSAPNQDTFLMHQLLTKMHLTTSNYLQQLEMDVHLHAEITEDISGEADSQIAVLELSGKIAMTTTEFACSDLMAGLPPVFNVWLFSDDEKNLNEKPTLIVETESIQVAAAVAVSFFTPPA